MYTIAAVEVVNKDKTLVGDMKSLALASSTVAKMSPEDFSFLTALDEENRSAALYFDVGDMGIPASLGKVQLVVQGCLEAGALCLYLDLVDGDECVRIVISRDGHSPEPRPVSLPQRVPERDVDFDELKRFWASSELAPLELEVGALEREMKEAGHSLRVVSEAGKKFDACSQSLSISQLVVEQNFIESNDSKRVGQKGELISPPLKEQTEVVGDVTTSILLGSELEDNHTKMETEEVETPQAIQVNSMAFKSEGGAHRRQMREEERRNCATYMSLKERRSRKATGRGGLGGGREHDQVLASPFPAGGVRRSRFTEARVRRQNWRAMPSVVTWASGVKNGCTTSNRGEGNGTDDSIQLRLDARVEVIHDVLNLAVYDTYV